MGEKVFGTSGAARELKVSEATLRRKPASRDSRGYRYYTTQDIERLRREFNKTGDRKT